MVKKNVYLTAILVAVDQGIKLIISLFYMDKSFILLPKVLIFQPVQNEHMNYIGSLLEIKTPLVVMILLEFVGGAMILLCCRYCMFLSIKRHWLLISFLSFGMAGILGAFIDSIFWGGSIDFIRLSDWFTFDLKDVYLNVMVISVILYMILYMPEYYKLNRADRKKTSISFWIKSGCPAEPTE